MSPPFSLTGGVRGSLARESAREREGVRARWQMRQLGGLDLLAGIEGRGEEATVPRADWAGPQGREGEKERRRRLGCSAGFGPRGQRERV